MSILNAHTILGLTSGAQNAQALIYVCEFSMLSQRHRDLVPDTLC